jgi:hypothetical protein
VSTIIANSDRDCSACINRRDFLKLVLIAGLAVGCTPQEKILPERTSEPPLPPTDSPTLQPEVIPTYSEVDFERMSYCGIRCWSACPELAYPSRCAGCKSEGEKRSAYGEICAIRKCASQKEVLTCAHCAEYPSCQADTWQVYPGLRRRIDQIRKDIGIDS